MFCLECNRHGHIHIVFGDEFNPVRDGHYTGYTFCSPEHLREYFAHGEGDFDSYAQERGVV